MTTHTAKIEGTPVRDLRTVTLAHPLNETDMHRLGLPTDGGTAEVGDKVKVTGNHAATLINAGYAQIDPEDNEAVAAALRLPTDDAEVGDSATPVAGTAAATPGGADKGQPSEGSAPAAPNPAPASGAKPKS